MKRVLIIGGSLGGLIAANLFHRAGWDVQVFEKVPGEMGGRGAGIATHPELLQVLARIGIPVDQGIGVQVMTRVTLDQAGHRIGDLHYPQVMTAWSYLYQLLRNALPAERYASGKELVAVEQDTDQMRGQVRARFADGSVVSGDLLIGADGIRSTVRQQFLPGAGMRYAGYVAWRGLVEEAELSPATHQSLFGHLGFCLPDREQMVGYPVAGANNALTEGERRYNFVWYRPADEAELRRLSTDDSGKVHDNGIPPPLISKAILKEIRTDAEAILAPQFVEIVDHAPQLFFQPIMDLASERIVFGRVALLGDAAFVARPHCGMGVTKAASDATSLVDAITALGLEQGLQRYDQERTAFGKRIVQHARHLGAYMQAQLQTEQERAMAEQYRTPEAVMRETAVPPLLD